MVARNVPGGGQQSCAVGARLIRPWPMSVAVWDLPGWLLLPVDWPVADVTADQDERASTSSCPNPRQRTAHRGHTHLGLTSDDSVRLAQASARHRGMTPLTSQPGQSLWGGAGQASGDDGPEALGWCWGRPPVTTRQERPAWYSHRPPCRGELPADRAPDASQAAGPRPSRPPGNDPASLLAGHWTEPT
jgi:hypothetical protein